MNIPRHLKSLLTIAVLIAVVDPTFAASKNVLSAADVNMRSGPGVNFRKVTTLVKDQIVTVHGCARAYTWCDVDWAGFRGWVSAEYLRLPGEAGGLASIATGLGISEIDYRQAEYTSRHYGLHAEPAGIRLRESGQGNAAALGEASDDQVILTEGTTYRPGDNRDILGGDISR